MNHVNPPLGIPKTRRKLKICNRRCLILWFLPTQREKDRHLMILVPHNSEWAAEFAAIRDVYMNSLGKLILRIEHVGSTAVPDLLAKPILDIDIVMPGYDVFPDIVTRLQTLGYAHNGDQGIKEREVFNSLDATAPYTSPPRHWMTHHLYVCPANSRAASTSRLSRRSSRPGNYGKNTRNKNSALPSARAGSQGLCESKKPNVATLSSA